MKQNKELWFAFSQLCWILGMGVLLFLMLAFPVRAEQIYTQDVNENWELTNPYSTYSMEGFYLELPNKPNTLYFNMTNYGYSVGTLGGIDSELTISSDTATLYQGSLGDLFGLDDNDLLDGNIFINFQTGFIGKWEGGSAYTAYTPFVDLTNARNVGINVVQSFEYNNPPPAWQAIWFVNTESTLTYSAMIVKFFSLGTLVGTTVWKNQGIDLPSNPTPPTDYYFIGWRTLNGDIFNEFAPILDEYINADGELILFARFVSMTGDELGIPEPPPSNIPQGLAVFLDAFGLDNEVGYFVIFFLLNLIPLVLMVLKKIPSYVFILISIVFFVTFIWLGMFPMWVIITLALIYITAFSFIVKKYAFREELGNEESA